MGRTLGDYELGKLGDRWCVTWYEEGAAGAKCRKRFRLQSSITDPRAKALAEMKAWQRTYEASLAATQGDLTIAQIFERYLEKLRLDGKKNDNARWTWKSLAPVFGDMVPEDIKAPVIVAGEERSICHDFALACARQGLARDTIWDRLACLRTALNWAYKQQFIDKPPYIWVPSKGAPRDIVWSEQEILRLLECCESPHVRLFILIAIATGARKTAILQLIWEQVDFGRRMIDFRNDSDKNLVSNPENILNRTKKKGRAVIEFGDTLAIALMEAKDAALTEYVIEFNGRAVANIKKGLSAAIKRAGLTQRGVGAHVIRHSTATWLADASVDMRRIQKMLGHKDMKTTETIYAKVRRGYLTEAANVIDLKLARKAV